MWLIGKWVLLGLAAAVVVWAAIELIVDVRKKRSNNKIYDEWVNRNKKG